MSFSKIRCGKCRNEQTVFDSAKALVNCKCGETIATPTGGKIKLAAQATKVEELQ